MTAPAAPAASETKRFKLTSKQYDRYVKARQKVLSAEQQLAAVRESLEGVAELILDAYGVDPSDQVSIDDATKELVVTKPPAPPADASAPPPAEPASPATESTAPAAPAA